MASPSQYLPLASAVWGQFSLRRPSKAYVQSCSVTTRIILASELRDRFPKSESCGGDIQVRAMDCPSSRFCRDTVDRTVLCRSIFAARPFSSVCGRLCERFRWGLRRPMPKSPSASADRSPYERWGLPAVQILWPWRSPATAWCAAMGLFRAIAGASSGSENCYRRTAGISEQRNQKNLRDRGLRIG